MLKEFKNHWEYDGLFVPKNAQSNTDFQKIQEFIKNGGEYEKFDYLKNAKEEKLIKLEAYILAKKTEPFTSHLAPEIIDGSKIGQDVKFYWYVNDIPNSNLTSESVLAKCTMDYVSCNDFARKTGTDYASEKTIYNTCIKQKIVPYPTTIIKDGKEQAGVVNIFPVAFSLAQHIQTREIQNNILLENKQIEINACKTVEEVEAIKFE
jgi:hypothetical protein